MTRIKIRPPRIDRPLRQAKRGESRDGNAPNSVFEVAMNTDE